MLVYPARRIVCQLIDVHVAGRHHAPGRGHPNLGFGKILIAESDGVQHRAARRSLHAIDDLGGKVASIFLVVAHVLAKLGFNGLAVLRMSPTDCVGGR